MKNGIFIPAGVVRAAVAAVSAVVALIALTELPEVRRYMKLKSM
ncbi:DUF6893 family small protein [Streptomyces luteolifulvus]|jgi:hypothetical protein|nr:hypothetical protein [Streptomyces luteolifulvus]